jgi:hypothetical protein
VLRLLLLRHLPKQVFLLQEQVLLDELQEQVLLPVQVFLHRHLRRPVR